MYKFNEVSGPSYIIILKFIYLDQCVATIYVVDIKIIFTVYVSNLVCTCIC